MNIAMRMLASQITDAMRGEFETMVEHGLAPEQYKALNSVLVSFANKYALSVLTRSVETVRYSTNPDLEKIQEQLDSMSDEERLEKANRLLNEADELQTEIVGFVIHAITIAARAGVVMGEVGAADKAMQDSTFSANGPFN